MKDEYKIKAKLEELEKRLNKELDGYGNSEMVRSYCIMIAILKWVLK